MLELRKDYILDEWVLIAANRSARPHDFKPEEDTPNKTDFFAPGNEDKTPTEIGRIDGPDGHWQMRWFENKFPAVKPEGQAQIETHDEFFTFSSGFGKHEIVVETPDDRQLWDFDSSELKTLLGVYQERVVALSEMSGIEYVQVFKNHGKAGGASLHHSHTQIMGINHVPMTIRKKIEAVKRFENDPYAKIIEKEMEGERRCFENDAFVAFCPYASKFNYELWIFPKEDVRSWSQLNLSGLADILHKILAKLKEMGCSYNITYHYAPKGAFRFHAHVTPRIANFAGYEIGTGEIINIVAPEAAAAFYRS